MKSFHMRRKSGDFYQGGVMISHAWVCTCCLVDTRMTHYSRRYLGVSGGAVRRIKNIQHRGHRRRPPILSSLKNHVPSDAEKVGDFCHGGDGTRLIHPKGTS